MKVKYLSEIPKRNIKKQKKFKKRRTGLELFYLFVYVIKWQPCLYYTVDVLPNAKAWKSMAMVYPVSAYV